MSELLLIYTAVYMFHMPFQDNDWLWKSIGFLGIGTFGSRFILQWIHSEREKKSIITPAFWWQSLFGTILCLLYFLRQGDLVGISGYVLNIVPYSRNLVLIYRRKRLDELEKNAAIPANPVDDGGPNGG